MDDPTTQAPQVLPYASREIRPIGRFTRFALAAAWVFPVLPLASLYATWLVAWVVLGHRPRSSMDDPKSISPLVDIFYLITALLLACYPLNLVVGVICSAMVIPSWLRHRGRGAAASLFVIAMLACLYVGSFVLLHWDPAYVLYWYMD